MNSARMHLGPLVVSAVLGAACSGGLAEQRQEPSFATLVAQLSEEGGYFDTDNLISNETSYLHVMGGLRDAGVRGGAYLGVGPDQNFSYIAQIRPAVAFLVDIRRDNLLLHLLFKGIFALARNRVEFLSLLLARPPPPHLATWNSVGVEQLVDYFDALGPDSAMIVRERRRVDSVIATFGVALSRADFTTIDRYHRTFIDAGLSLQFRSLGRAPRFYYPTYRDLLLERDLTARRASYLATEEAFQFVRELQHRDRVVPVVGDLAGPHAVRAIAQYLEQRQLAVSAYYTSNVEFYLFRGRAFDRYAANVLALPRDERSVIIRSVFHSTIGPHPLAVAGYYSTQLLQTIDGFQREYDSGGFRTYWDVVTKRVIR